VYVLVSMPVPYFFGYYSSVVCFEIRYCDGSIFALFAQDCLGYFGSFVVPYEF
jgi:hypothetical protein